MVMSSYSKQRVISLYSQGETVSSIVDRLVLEDGVQVSKQGVRNLLKRYVRYCAICRRPGSGCPSKITPGIKQIILRKARFPYQHVIANFQSLTASLNTKNNTHAHTTYIPRVHSL